MTSPNDRTDFYSDNRALTEAMGAAVREALRTHKLLGEPIVVWRDGQVVWVPADEIELPATRNGANGHA